MKKTKKMLINMFCLERPVDLVDTEVFLARRSCHVLNQQMGDDHVHKNTPNY